MQSLDVISINLWHILISLCNLLILFFILKKFLYQPVRRVNEERDTALKNRYSEAENARCIAEETRLNWEQKMQNAESEANDILSDASERANRMSSEIISQAKENADIIINNAKKESEAEHKKAREEIKKEIVDVSAVLSEKILGREINTDDHHELIGKIISEMGEEND